jgi:hypothetical protein
VEGEGHADELAGGGNNLRGGLVVGAEGAAVLETEPLVQHHPAREVRGLHFHRQCFGLDAQSGVRYTMDRSRVSWGGTGDGDERGAVAVLYCLESGRKLSCSQRVKAQQPSMNNYYIIG